MVEQGLYNKFAKYYDKVYSFKDYDKEIDFIKKIIKKHKLQPRNILDVACGTGEHTIRLNKIAPTIGLDLNKPMLDIAKQKYPEIEFEYENMINFSLKKKFDIITCLFTAISYITSLSDLVKVLKNFKNHLTDEGLIFFDFPIPERKGFENAMRIDDNNVVLYFDSVKEKGMRELNLFWICNDKDGATVERDTHILRFYTEDELRECAEKAGLKVDFNYNWSPSKKKAKRAIVICSK